MTEEKSLFDQLEEGNAGKPPRSPIIPVIGVLIILGVAATLYTNRDKIGFTAASKKTTVSEEDTKFLEYIDFAERFAVAAFNMSYTDLNGQVERVADMMSNDVLEYYKNNFLSTKFRQKFLERRIYVVFQKIDRAQVEADKGNQVDVRVAGESYFNSDVTGTQIQIPFAFTVSIQRRDGRLQVVDFKQRI